VAFYVPLLEYAQKGRNDAGPRPGGIAGTMQLMTKPKLK